MLVEWEAAKNNRWIKQSNLNDLNQNRRDSIISNKLIYQGGKGNGKLVPVIIVKEIVDTLNLISNEVIREKCGVSPFNKYLFASTQGSLDHVAGYNTLQTITVEAGVTKNLTATKMRHRASTLFGELEMSLAQREFFYSHMGHSEDINKSVYQCPAGLNELHTVGSYLTQIEKDAGSSSSQSLPLGMYNIKKLYLLSVL